MGEIGSSKTSCDSLPFEIIGAEFDSGGRVRGTSLAPKALREYGLYERLKILSPSLIEGKDLSTPLSSQHSISAHPRLSPPNVNDLPQAVEFCNSLYSEMRSLLRRGNRPILIGGDHSVSVGSVSAVSDHVKDSFGADAKIGLLWVDAHPDLNTPESSPSGNLHGMVARILLGEGPKELVEIGFAHGTPFKAPRLMPHNLAQIGLRDVDPPEKIFIKQNSITAKSMKDIDIFGAYKCLEDCLETITKNTVGIYVSFDLDVCDPSIAPGVDTPVRGGLSFREAHLVMERIAQVRPLLGIELVEYDPKRDIDHASADLAIALIESALGKSIL